MRLVKLVPEALEEPAKDGVEADSSIEEISVDEGAAPPLVLTDRASDAVDAACGVLWSPPPVPRYGDDDAAAVGGRYETTELVDVLDNVAATVKEVED